MKVSPGQEPSEANPSTGLTLLEVLLALTILATALVILSQLAAIGMRAAREARELTHAQLLCESLMAEMTAGSMMSATQGEVPNAPGWSFQAITESAGQAGLVRLVVTVQNSIDPVYPISFTLTRIMRDPSLPIPVDPVVEEEDESTNTTNNTSATTMIEFPPQNTGREIAI